MVHKELQEIYYNNPEYGYQVLEITLALALDSTLIEDLALQGCMADEGYEFLQRHLRDAKVG